MPLLQIANKQMVEGFEKRWTFKGVSIFMDDVHRQFAADFANMLITSFVEQQQAKAKEAAKPKVISTEG